MARIIHPRPEMGRKTFFDIEFVDGVGHRDLTDAPNLTTALIQHGYIIEPDLDYLGDWTKQKLVKYAGEQGIDLGKAKTKAEILAVIEVQALDAIVSPEDEVTDELEKAGVTAEDAVTAAPSVLDLANAPAESDR